VRIMRALIFVIALFGLGKSNAYGVDPIPVNFNGKGVPGYIGRNAVILSDSSGNMTWKEAMASSQFRSCAVDVPNLGTTNSAYWLKFQVLNTSGSDRFFFSVEHAEIDELDLFVVKDQGILHIAEAGQSRRSVHSEDSPAEFAFQIQTAAGMTETLLLRVKSSKQLQIPVRVISVSNFHEALSVRNWALGAYVGIMLVMSLYNLFVYISIRDKSYLIYVLYIISIMLAQLTFLGIGHFYLWPDQIWWAQRASVLLSITSAIAASEFLRAFLNTKEFGPKFDQLFPWAYLFLAFFGAIFSFFDPIPGYQLVQLGTAIIATFMLIVAINLKWRGSRQAGFFIVAWSAFLIGVVLYVFKDIGILAYNKITVYTMPVGSAMEAVLLSFGLADRINVLRREKEHSQAAELRSSQENERIIREQNVTLENKVNERTHALQESNEHLKHTQTKLVNAEKMASLGQLTAGIAHEINNPINFISSNIQPLRRNIAEILEVMEGYRSIEASKVNEQLIALKLREEELGISESIHELDEIIGSMAEGSSRTAEIVRGLRNFSRLDEDDLKPTDLNEGIRSTLTLLGPQLKDKVTIALDLTELPAVECFPGKVNQVFMNILTNAIHATKAKGGDQKPWIQITSHCNAGHAIICIRDNGSGMSAEVKTRIFDPFFTTKPVGEGTGLGLAIVYGIIEDHHGSISVGSVVGEGSTFTITLPLLQEQLVQRRA